MSTAGKWISAKRVKAFEVAPTTTDEETRHFEKKMEELLEKFERVTQERDALRIRVEQLEEALLKKKALRKTERRG